MASFSELNAYLLDKCRANDLRQVKGEPTTIGEAWEQERTHLRPLPVRDYACCVTAPVTLTPYSQVIFETNRYSVPVDQAQRKLVVSCLLYTSDAADERSSVDIGGGGIIEKKKKEE